MNGHEYVDLISRYYVSDQAKEERLRQEQLAQAQREAEERARIVEQERKAAEAKKQNGTHNGHNWVDLGLSVKWATCNVGATSPEEYGDYFAWGETSTKRTYNWSTYKWSKGSWSKGSEDILTKYCTKSNFGRVDNKTTLELADDAARAKWGGAWRMPTAAEWTELRTKCTWTWTTRNGVIGYTVKSNINGNSIFLPAAGYCDDQEGSYLADCRGFYWSSSLNTGPFNAWRVHFGSYHVNRDFTIRRDGLSVRPVF